MMTVSEALDFLVSAYGDLDLIARGLPVSASEVASAKVEADTAEAFALELLKKYNPYKRKVTMHKEIK